MWEQDDSSKEQLLWVKGGQQWKSVTFGRAHLMRACRGVSHDEVDELAKGEREEQGNVTSDRLTIK